MPGEIRIQGGSILLNTYLQATKFHNNAKIGLSLHGWSAAMDGYKLFKRGEGSWERVREHFNHLDLNVFEEWS